MEKLLYFDPFNGVSGDMILAALIDLGLPLSHLEVELKKLGLEGYQLSAEPIQRQGLFGTNFEVRLTGNSGFPTATIPPVTTLATSITKQVVD